MKLYEKETENGENKNSFKTLIDICKNGGKQFGDVYVIMNLLI